MLEFGVSTVVAVLLVVSTSVGAQEVRLVGSGSPREGRVEVRHNGSWGTVCDTGFSDAAARVVCHMLGHQHAGQFIYNVYGPGNGRVWLDRVRCSGSETSIADCGHSGWGRVRGCDHDRDVSVSCVTVRLIAGRSPREGRLEVRYNATWGTVCGDGFDDAAASVVCRSLGYDSVGRFVGNRYGAGPGSLRLDAVRCNGTENSIADCELGRWDSYDCDRVSVLCPTVRLAGGTSPREGRLEVYHDGAWGTVCDDGGFTDAAARVVCYSLGYEGGVGRHIGSRYGAGSGTIWLGGVRCNGTERHIDECSHAGWAGHDCRAHVSVACRYPTAVRLVDGPSSRNGRLEVLYNGRWGTVCDDLFIDAAARVVCYMLGYGHTGWVSSFRLYGAGSGQIWLDNVTCNGTETSIEDCRHNGWGVHDCGHSEDVGVWCPPDSSSTTTTTSSPSTVSYTRSSSSPTGRTNGSTSPTSVSSTASAHNGGGGDSTPVIMAAIVVVGLVACVIVVALVLLLRSRRNSSRRQKTAVVFPMYSTSFGVSNNSTEDSSGFQASRDVHAVGDDDIENTYEEPFDTNY